MASVWNSLAPPISMTKVVRLSNARILRDQAANEVHARAQTAAKCNLSCEGLSNPGTVPKLAAWRTSFAGSLSQTWSG